MASRSRFDAMYQRVKNAIHALQSLLIFIAAMITIAIFTQDGFSDGRITYFFILCLLSFLFLIYQAAVPTWQRSKRFANAYAHAMIDMLLTILWFAAFIAEITWATDGTQAGKDYKNGDSVCQVFGYGSTDKCHLGQVTAYFGVAIFILFVVTSTFAIYAVFYYRKDGTLPGSGHLKNSETGQSDDLEFNGTSPHAYDQFQSQPEMQQSPADEGQHGRHATSPQAGLHDDQATAVLPPRPIYPKAPRTPLQQQAFEPFDPEDYGAETHNPPQAYSSDVNPYREYSYGYDDHAGGDYAAAAAAAVPPPRHQSSMAELPTINVDTRFGYGFGGGANLAFPEADYSR